MDIKEMDLQLDSFVRTSKGGVIMIAREPRTNKIYRIHFNKNDFDWLVGSNNITGVE